MLDAAADAFDALERAARAPTRYPTFKVVQSAGALRDGVAAAHLDPDRHAAREPALPRHPRDGAPVVLRARRQRPGAPAVRRRGRRRLRRPLPSSACAGASRCATGPPGPLDLRVLGAPATTRTSTSRAATCSTTRRGRMGSTAFWAALRGYVAANRYGLVDDADAARRARRRRRRSTSGRRCSGRGSRGSTDAPVATARASGLAAATRRSAASACGICRNAAGSSGRQARQPATSQRRDDALARAPRQAVRLADGRRQQADGRPERPGIGRGRDARQPRRSTPGRAAAAGSVSASSRASGPTWTGPSGASIAAT